MHSSRTIARLLLTLAGLTLLTLPLHAADAPKSFAGTWNNKKFNTSGPMTCAIIGEQNGQWIARFSGTGMGSPFTQVAYITPKGSGGNTNLTGVAKVNGDNYRWSGTASDKAMVGSFRSDSGNNGDFRLQVGGTLPASNPVNPPNPPNTKKKK